MIIKPSTASRNNYNEISDLARETGEPIYLTKNGEGDLVVCNIDVFTRQQEAAQRELERKKAWLKDEILRGRAWCEAGHPNLTMDEFKKRFDKHVDMLERSQKKNNNQPTEA